MLKKVSLLCVAFTLAGCNTTPEYKPRMARFDNPEVFSQPFHFRSSIGSDSSNQISSNAKKGTDKGDALRAEIAMTLGKGFEIGYVNNGHEKFSLKYQFYGKNREYFEPGNFSHAVSLGYGQTDDDGHNYDYDTYWLQKNDFIDLAWITGYRFTENLQMYGGVFYQKGQLNLNYYATRSRTNYSDGNKIFRIDSECTSFPDTKTDACFLKRYDLDGDNVGVNLGIEYRILRWMSMMFEVTHTRANWYGQENGETAANVNLSFHY